MSSNDRVSKLSKNALLAAAEKLKVPKTNEPPASEAFRPLKPPPSRKKRSPLDLLQDNGKHKASLMPKRNKTSSNPKRQKIVNENDPKKADADLDRLFEGDSEEDKANSNKSGDSKNKNKAKKRKSRNEATSQNNRSFLVSSDVGIDLDGVPSFKKKKNGDEDDGQMRNAEEDEATTTTIILPPPPSITPIQHKPASTHKKSKPIPTIAVKPPQQGGSSKTNTSKNTVNNISNKKALLGAGIAKVSSSNTPKMSNPKPSAKSSLSTTKPVSGQPQKNIINNTVKPLQHTTKTAGNTKTDRKKTQHRDEDEADGLDSSTRDLIRTMFRRPGSRSSRYDDSDDDDDMVEEADPFAIEREERRAYREAVKIDREEEKKEQERAKEKLLRKKKLLKNKQK